MIEVVAIFWLTAIVMLILYPCVTLLVLGFLILDCLILYPLIKLWLRGLN